MQPKSFGFEDIFKCKDKQNSNRNKKEAKTKLNTSFKKFDITFYKFNYFKLLYLTIISSN